MRLCSKKVVVADLTASTASHIVLATIFCTSPFPVSSVLLYPLEHGPDVPGGYNSNLLGVRRGVQITAS